MCLNILWDSSFEKVKTNSSPFNHGLCLGPASINMRKMLVCDFREKFTEWPQRKDTDVFDNNNLKHLFIKTQSKKYKPQNVKKYF